MFIQWLAEEMLGKENVYLVSILRQTKHSTTSRYVLSAQCIPFFLLFLVALIPQAEELNKKVKNDRLASNGFHVHYLPYADDMRQLPKNDTTRANTEEVELFKSVVRGLKFKYRPDKFENPALQTLWRSIEATALNKGEPEEFIDLTVPSVENQNRKVAGFIDELKQMIFPPGYVMGTTKKTAAAKRKVTAIGFISSRKAMLELLTSLSSCHNRRLDADV